MGSERQDGGTRGCSCYEEHIQTVLGCNGTCSYRVCLAKLCHGRRDWANMSTYMVSAKYQILIDSSLCVQQLAAILTDVCSFNADVGAL